MDKKEKLIEWLEMDEEDKRKWNGFNGFLKGEKFSEGNEFFNQYKRKLERKNNHKTEWKKDGRSR